MSANAVVWVDEDYDRQTSSSGSRYAAYLAQHARSFRDPWDESVLAGAVDFAAAAWWVACSPVMAPGYVRLRPDIASVTVGCDEDGEGLRHLDVEIRLDLDDLSVSWRLAQADSWARTWAGDARVYYRPQVKRPTLLTTAHLLIPTRDEDLPTPNGVGKPFDGTVDVADAKASVRALAAMVNRETVPVLAVLRGER